MQILLIEDERPLAQAVIRLLTENRYQVDWVRSGNEGLRAAESKEYDLIVMDILVPGLSGWEVCKHLRERRINTQLLILSAMDEPGDIVRGLDMGADDYLCKPFETEELLARVRARLRTGRTHLSRRIRIGDLAIDRVDQTVQRNGRTIPLTGAEYGVMERLAADAGKTVPAQVLAREAGFVSDPLGDPLEICLKSLQRKIKDSGSKHLIHRVADGYVVDPAFFVDN